MRKVKGGVRVGLVGMNGLQQKFINLATDCNTEGPHIILPAPRWICIKPLLDSGLSWKGNEADQVLGRERGEVASAVFVDVNVPESRP